MAQHAALLAVFAAVGGIDGTWTNASGWGGPQSTEWSWYGVVCDNSGAASGLTLSGDSGYGNGLTGTWPADSP